MSLAEQFDLFRDEDLCALDARVLALEKSQDKVRKNLFAKHGDVVKMLLEILHRVEQLEGKRNEEN